MSEHTPWWDTDEPKQQETPWWDTDAPDHAAYDSGMSPAPTTGPKRLDASDMKQRLWQWLNQNLHTVIYMAIGLCLAIGILKIGFWRTFLVAFCLAGGYILGSWHDGNPKLIHRLHRFSQRFIDDNPFMNKHH